VSSFKGDKMGFKITKKELKARGGYILLGFFTFYMVDPVREWVANNFTTNPMLIGIVGILITLYLFEF